MVVADAGCHCDGGCGCEKCTAVQAQAVAGAIGAGGSVCALTARLKQRRQ